ncbi:regulatory protein RecX [Kosmotoga pacifica]|uniref:Regulatory protein RecX n=1 Tax=Kosmotoga pacifica TaxID=1330330 RepID=A0A0G2ZDU0_9BACT|nr:RecX family transcriptional regulator [Kosmotoga pacifica]AKI96958.1 hypothetical protein IX53_03000 [Kosmotoga pacifica]
MNRSEKSPEFERAKSDAFRLLKYRSRAEKEIFKRLKEKGYPFQVITEVVAWLKEHGFVDDEMFAWLYAYDALKVHFKGPYRIERELLSLGISKEIVTKTLSRLKDEIDITSVLKAYLERVRFDIDDSSAIEKLKAKLYRRGFASSMIDATLREILNSHET